MISYPSSKCGLDRLTRCGPWHQPVVWWRMWTSIRQSRGASFNTFVYFHPLDFLVTMLTNSLDVWFPVGRSHVNHHLCFVLYFFLPNSAFFFHRPCRMLSVLYHLQKKRNYLNLCFLITPKLHCLTNHGKEYDSSMMQSSGLVTFMHADMILYDVSMADIEIIAFHAWIKGNLLSSWNGDQES